jgi:hypothetical protein
MLRKITIEVETEDYPDEEEFATSLSTALKNMTSSLRSAIYTVSVQDGNGTTLFIDRGEVRR